MTTPWLASYLILWGLVLGTGFLLLGTLRSLGRLQWRLDELEATRPVRKGREGLPPGKQAPEFTLPSAAGGDVSLSDFAGRRVLLVFTQSGCGPCHKILPHLNRVQQNVDHQVLVVNSGEAEDAADMAAESAAGFPILTQEEWRISKQYQVFATPYAFVVDESGVIAAKGVVSTPQYIRYLFEAAQQRDGNVLEISDRDSLVEREPVSSSTSREVIHA